MDNCDYLDDSRNLLPIDNDQHSIIDGPSSASLLLIHNSSPQSVDGNADPTASHRFERIDYRDDIMDTPLLFDNEYAAQRSQPCLIAEQGYNGARDDTQSNGPKRQLILAISLCFVFMIAEIVGGYMAGSLAIMADAAHLLTDCVSFIVALVAIWMSKRPPDHRMTFGYKRVEVMGAILSIFGIWLLTAFLCFFSVSRLIQNDFDIEAPTMMVISAIGICINVIMAFILHGSCCSSHGHSHGGHGHSHGSLGGHGHSHSPPIDRHRSKYKRLSTSTTTGDELGSKHLLNGVTKSEVDHSSYLINGSSYRVRSDSVCSHRSPGHSRTNSFSGMTNQSQMRLDEASLCSNGRNNHHHNHRSDSVDSEIQLHPSEHSHANHSCKNESEVPTTKKNINIQAAAIHVIGDFIQSVGVFIAAVIIYYYPDAKIVDPLCTFLFSIIVMFTTVRIMRESISIILDAVPENVDIQSLHNELICIPGVRSVHHLTVWNVTVDWPVMAVHLVVDASTNTEKILRNATELASDDFGIKHCTIQLEPTQPPSLAALHEHIDRNGDIMINFV